MHLQDRGDPDARIIAEFNANEGRVGGYFADLALLLLTTIGARSGRERTVPLTYLADDDRYVIVAADAGADRHPAWYHNLILEPAVAVRVGADEFRATARVARGDERLLLFDRFAAAYPQTRAYQARTSRQFPVIVLERI